MFSPPPRGWRTAYRRQHPADHATTSRPARISRLLVLRSHDGWRTARERSRDLWPDQDPTTVAASPFGDYAVSGDIAVWFTGATTDTFTLRRR